MAHTYARQPSSKSSRVPVDEGWAQPPSAHGQSHRGGPFPSEVVSRQHPQQQQHGGDRLGGNREIIGGGMGAPVGSGRLVEMLDAVRQEFEGISHDNSSLKSQREEFEAKAAAQIVELSQIKNAVQELEAVHQKTRQQYEDEIRTLRAEIQALRSQPPPPPPPTQGRSELGLSLPPGSQGGHPNNNGGPMPGVLSTGPGGYQGGELYDRDRERDRGDDRRKPKDERREPHALQTRSPPSQQQEIVPRAGSPEFPGSLSPRSLPANLRKEGPDWFAMYNPHIPKKTLDVDLVHQFNHESVVCCVRFSKDGKYLATGCNRTAQIFDMQTGAMVCQLSDDKAVMDGDLYIRSVCFSPDGKFLATGAEDRQIRIWDIAKKRIRNLFEGHEQEIYSLDFSSSGHLIVSGSGDKTARIWDMETGNSTVLAITDPAPTPGGDGDTAMMVPPESGAVTDAGVTSVAISPDGRLVAAGSLDTVVRLWDVQTGTLLERLRGHRDSVYSVAFTPDGRGLVSGSLDKTLKYWELNTNALRALVDGQVKPGASSEKYAKCMFDFVGHKDYVLSVAISHNGQWVVSGSKDRGVQFWDKNGTAQLMLQGHKNSVISIDLSPTGGYLATGSGDWQARVSTGLVLFTHFSCLSGSQVLPVQCTCLFSCLIPNP
ncbi:hypothetical protein M408DRAFT_334157 [Serendipita vermifera MAFF 305830]|uniref:Transcriptional repressor Tup1 N-terminal domain-containing protein n=1 Tax=Serendipita vermifera MAFF 305830 TaxID=933852 RepID=A0A0C2W0M8_SERVB|nr:hypothetical protein M408DRAFT_334157 [Serendipita vermifera MAFF 305830]